jgi:hypothetical protein
VPVADDARRRRAAIAVLCSPAIAEQRQNHFELALDQLFDEGLHPVAHRALDRIEPAVEKTLSASSRSCPAVLVATLVCGVLISATLLGAVSAWWLFIALTHQFVPIEPASTSASFLYLLSSAVIVCAAGRHQTIMPGGVEGRHREVSAYPDQSTLRPSA